jgi:hypothetical protein
MELKIKMRLPLSDDTKLYSTRINSLQTNASGATFVMLALDSLIEKAELLKFCKVDSERFDAPPDMEVNTIISNENATFRDKLRTLAIASSTLVKMDPATEQLIVSSIERSQKPKRTEIKLECLLLQNNIYSFSMQSPMKDKIYSAIEISYCKNFATGEYEHKILVSGKGIMHDGESSGNTAETEKLEWTALCDQLNKNAESGIINTKCIENEWLRDKEGAERAAYSCLSWCCSPLRKAQIKCVRNGSLPDDVDIGKFVYFSLPGYPDKLGNTTWLVTGMTDNLDSRIVTIDLLEAWNMPSPLAGEYILTEDRELINTENELNSLAREK